jgi:hypothetical protein
MNYWLRCAVVATTYPGKLSAMTALAPIIFPFRKKVPPELAAMDH